MWAGKESQSLPVEDPFPISFEKAQQDGAPTGPPRLMRETSGLHGHSTVLWGASPTGQKLHPNGDTAAGQFLGAVIEKTICEHNHGSKNSLVKAFSGKNCLREEGEGLEYPLPLASYSIKQNRGETQKRCHSMANLSESP